VRILYVATVGLTSIFFERLITELTSKGDVVDFAASDDGRFATYLEKCNCKITFLPFSRSPFSLGNFVAIRRLKKLIVEGNYDVVHCHTPIAAFCTRIACRKLRKKGLKVIYTAHGFHFFKGAPLKNWLIYYPLEKLCSRWTDVLITINKEDYELALGKMQAVRTEYVSGVGVDFQRFSDVVVDRDAKRRELDIPTDAYLMCSVGEMIPRKNHRVVIRALAAIKNPNVYYIIVGYGRLRDYLQELAQELGIADQVRFLGFRKDIAELYKISDLCVFPSIQEGLPIAPLEGMACGVPLLCAENRGTREFALNGVNALVCPWNDVDAFKNAIDAFVKGNALKNFDSKRVVESLRKYEVKDVNERMEEIYRSL